MRDILTNSTQPTLEKQGKQHKRGPHGKKTAQEHYLARKLLSVRTSTSHAAKLDAIRKTQWKVMRIELFALNF